jgi:predicted HicB family RNase H-like nuclease
MTPLTGVVRPKTSLQSGVAGRTRTEEVSTMTEAGSPNQTGTPGSGKTLGVKLSDETHAQLVLISGLEQVSLADLIRQAIDVFLEHKRGDETLAARAAEAAREVEREAAIRRDALNALFGSQAQAGEPAARRRGKEQPAS